MEGAGGFAGPARAAAHAHPSVRASAALPPPVQAAAAAGSAPSVFRVQQIAASLVGFLCYKAAVVGVAIIPPPVDETGAQLAPDGTPRRADTPRD